MIRQKMLWLPVLMSRSCRHFGISSSALSEFKTLKYKVKDQIAHVQLNRPDALNAITEDTPTDIMNAIQMAEMDNSVKIIVLSGAGTSFCAGYDLKEYAEKPAGTFACIQTMPWDPHLDYQFMSYCTNAWMSLWRCTKPTICKIHGYAIGGGSDLALCCDLTVAADTARIGYPPARVWGCPTTAMWAYRLPAETAKRILFTGNLLTGTEAYNIGLVGECVSGEDLDGAVDRIAGDMLAVPSNQLFFHKSMINASVEQQGLQFAQRLATLYDGMARHSPEGQAFQHRALQVGFKQAVKERDSKEVTQWSNMKKPAN